MPYERQMNDQEASEFSGASCFAYKTGVPYCEFSLWPYRSLSRRGFVWFISITTGMISIPLLAFLGSMHLWIMFPFVAAALAAIWYSLERSYKDGSILETLTIWSDHVELTRQNPRGPTQHWSANPHWVSLKIHPETGPVDNYLTLRGGTREVELGAFLSPDQRKALKVELQSVLDTLPK